MSDLYFVLESRQFVMKLKGIWREKIQCKRKFEWMRFVVLENFLIRTWISFLQPQPTYFFALNTRTPQWHLSNPQENCCYMASSWFNCGQSCEINKTNCENWKLTSNRLANMQYDSQLEVIWAKVSSEGSLRRPTSSRKSFRNVCDAFYQAEECPHSPPVSPNIKAYRAEWNTWAYYCK